MAWTIVTHKYSKHIIGIYIYTPFKLGKLMMEVFTFKNKVQICAHNARTFIPTYVHTHALSL